MSFQQLGLSENILKGVQAMGYTDATPIQLRAIPVILSGRDVTGSAQTGTGKTAAFALPMLSRLGEHGKLRCLILEPTRELAAQVETAFRDYSRFTNLRTTVLYGGTGYGKQREDLTKGVDVVVATPGRLLDHLNQRTLHLRDLTTLVLDEADRMLDMGFIPDVRRIINQCPKKRQTLLFSATVPPEISHLASWVLNNPESIEIGINRSPAETVSHAFYPVAEDQKFDLLLELLERTHYESVLVFSRTKHEADRIVNRLKEAGHSVAVLHSNRTQRERMDALDGFKSGKYEVMVATDIASRGIDVEGISHVINYDIPLHPEDYVHRIGRTGRAQKVGVAFTLITAGEYKHVHAVEHFIGQSVPRVKLDNFKYEYTVLLDPKAPQPGTRRSGGGAFGRRRRR